MTLINSWQFIGSLASARTRAAASMALTFLGLASADFFLAFASGAAAGGSATLVVFLAVSAWALVVFFADMSDSLGMVVAAAPRTSQRQQGRTVTSRAGGSSSEMCLILSFFADFRSFAKSRGRLGAPGWLAVPPL